MSADLNRSIRPAHGGGPLTNGTIDFSSNIHPMPPPAKVWSAVEDSLLRDASQYPDARAWPLRERIASLLGLTADRVLASAGSADLLLRIIQAICPSRLILPTPCFSEYPHLSVLGVEVELIGPTQDFSLPPPPASIPHGAAAVLCDPGNPTGRCAPPQRLREWISAFGSAGGCVILDQAYADFCEGGAAEPDRDALDRGALIALKSMTKFYSIPGLRIGYALMSASHASRIEPFLPPWPLSGPAVSAALAALDVPASVAQVRREQIRRWSAALRADLQAIGLTVLPSDVHFFLVQLPEGRSGSNVSEALDKRHVRVRTARDIPGLDDRYIRVAARTPADNACLIAALRDCIGTI